MAWKMNFDFELGGCYPANGRPGSGAQVQEPANIMSCVVIIITDIYFRVSHMA